MAYSSLLLVDVVAVPPVGSPFFRFAQAHPDVLGELPAAIHAAIVRTYIQGASAGTLRADTVDGAGHLVQHDAPAALADEIRAWLDRDAEGMRGRRPDLPLR